MRWREKRSKQWEQLGQRQGLAIAQHSRRTSFVAGNGTKTQKNQACHAKVFDSDPEDDR